MNLPDLVAAYRQGTASVIDALDEIGFDRLDVRPPTGWTARMVVHHLADAETVGAFRLRQLLAEDNPALQGYDEVGYAERLAYHRPIDVSVATFIALRASNLELLDGLDETDLQRSGIHTERGAYSVADWLRIYTGHAVDHAGQMRRAAAGDD